MKTRNIVLGAVLGIVTLYYITLPATPSRAVLKEGGSEAVTGGGGAAALLAGVGKAVGGGAPASGVVPVVGAAPANAEAAALASAKAEKEGGDPARASIFNVKCQTSEGPFVVEVHRDWAPLGAERFKELVEAKFYDEARFFRVLPKFVAQFGIAADPGVMAEWRDKRLKDDPVIETNAKGTITFATSGPNSRTTQLFINLNNNAGLDGQGFSPFGKVVSGMTAVENLYSGYGEGAPKGKGPNQGQIQSRGNEYLKESFPLLSFVETCRVEV